MSKRRPTGPYTPITAQWQDRVRDELKRREWTRGDLADRIGCSGGAITQLLDPLAAPKSSRLVDLINLVLDIAAPVYDDDFDQMSHLGLKKIKKANRELYDKIVQDILRAARSTPEDEK